MPGRETMPPFIRVRILPVRNIFPNLNIFKTLARALKILLNY